jgi:hypothetical protein
MADFDVEGARKAGHSDADIVDYLASDQNINVQKARKYYSDPELIQQLMSSKVKLSPEDTPSIGKTMLIGAGRTFDRIGKGMQQGYYGVTGNDKAQAALKEQVDSDNAAYEPLANTRPIASGIGEALPSMVLPIGSTASAATTAAKLFASGAVPTALEYGSASERAKNAGISGVGATVGGMVIPKIIQGGVQLARRAGDSIMGAISPEVMALYQRAQQFGIPISRAQLSNSKFMKTLASAVENLPFSGATATKEAARDQFNRAISRTFGEDSTVVDRNLYDSARTRLGAEFDRLSNRNEFQVTPQVMTEVNDLLQRSQNYTTPQTAAIIENVARGFRSRLDTNTMTIPGSVYQDTDTMISKMLKNPQESAPWIGELRDILRAGMDNSIRPDDQVAWNTARDQYRNLKAVRDLVAKEGADGNISPAALMNRMNANGAGKESMARGTRGDLGDIAVIGKQFLKDQIPNSGTAQRLLAQGVLGAAGGGAVLGGADPSTIGALMLAGATSGRMTNRILNKPFVAGIAGPTFAQIASSIPSRGTQVLGSGAGMTLAELLNQE